MCGHLCYVLNRLFNQSLIFCLRTFVCGSENENMGTVGEERSCEYEREFHAHYHELLLQLKDNIILNKSAFLFQISLFIPLL